MRAVTIGICCLAVGLAACDKRETKKRSGDDDETTTARTSASASSNTAALRPRGEPPSGWTLLAPKDAGYSVFMPGVAEKLDTDVADMRAVKRPSGSAYLAMCTSSTEPDEGFKGMRRGKIGERKLLSATKIDDGRKGERLAIELLTDKGVMVSNELLLIGRAGVCSFSALVPQAVDEAADIDRFFASARIEI